MDESRHISLSDSNCCLEPVSSAAVEEDCTSGLVKEVFDDSDKSGADPDLCCQKGRKSRECSKH